jgi:hypothetical protein
MEGVTGSIPVAPTTHRLEITLFFDFSPIRIQRHLA